MFNPRPSNPPSSSSPVGSAATSEAAQNEPGSAATASVHSSSVTIQDSVDGDGVATTRSSDLWYWLGKRDTRTAEAPESEQGSQGSDDAGLGKRDSRSTHLGSGGPSACAESDDLEYWLGKRDNRSAEESDSTQPNQGDEPTRG